MEQGSFLRVSLISQTLKFVTIECHVDILGSAVNLLEVFLERRAITGRGDTPLDPSVICKRRSTGALTETQRDVPDMNQEQDWPKHSSLGDPRQDWGEWRNSTINSYSLKSALGVKE